MKVGQEKGRRFSCPCFTLLPCPRASALAPAPDPAPAHAHAPTHACVPSHPSCPSPCPRSWALQVRCWQHHDTTGHAVLIGDAAHATPPSIGQGCNASLVDASVLGRLLVGEWVTEDLRAPDEVEHARGRRCWEEDPSPGAIRQRLPHILERFSALQVRIDDAVGASALGLYRKEALPHVLDRFPGLQVREMPPTSAALLVPVLVRANPSS